MEAIHSMMHPNGSQRYSSTLDPSPVSTYLRSVVGTYSTRYVHILVRTLSLSLWMYVRGLQYIWNGKPTCVWSCVPVSGARKLTHM